MTDQNKSARPDRGIFNRTDAGRLQPADRIAIALGVCWLLAVGAIFLLAGEGAGSGFDPVRVLMAAVIVFLPVGFLWLGALMARNAGVTRTESERLRAAIDAIRQAQAAGADPPSGPAVAPAAETGKAEKPLTPDHRTGGKEQAEKPDISIPAADFIRALNFPDSEHDAEGFAILRRALKDRQTAKLLRASEDILTLLSQEGIYTDDLRPDHARPDIWRRFAAGERGPGVAPLGGINDRSALALSAGRMQRDQVFRDAAQHFLREFDKTFAGFEHCAGDGEIMALADTRTGRAFMLLGRVAGLFG